MAGGSVVVVGGTRGLGRELAQFYAGQGRDVVITGRDAAAAAACAAEIGGSTRGLGLDLAEPESIATGLADVGDVEFLVLAAIERDTNTVKDYDIAAAMRLVTLKIVGYTEVDPCAPAADGRGRRRADLRRPRPRPALSRLDDRDHRERRRDRARADARDRARSEARERAPPGDRRRQPPVARHAGGAVPGPRRTNADGTARDDGSRSSTRRASCSRMRAINGINLPVDGGWLCT